MSPFLVGINHAGFKDFRSVWADCKTGCKTVQKNRRPCVRETGDCCEMWHGTSCPWTAHTLLKPTGLKRYLIHSLPLSHSLFADSDLWFSLSLCRVTPPVLPLSNNTFAETHTQAGGGVSERSDIQTDGMSRRGPSLLSKGFSRMREAPCLWRGRRDGVKHKKLLLHLAERQLAGGAAAVWKRRNINVERFFKVRDRYFQVQLCSTWHDDVSCQQNLICEASCSFRGKFNIYSGQRSEEAHRTFTGTEITYVDIFPSNRFNS